MPLQNRVTPLGDLIAVPERGTVFGNRGMLHDAGGRIVRYSRGRRWITCRLAFRGRRRAPMPPGAYTGLFFLDEATALAAGHRPCAECRHADYQSFRRHWSAAHLEPGGALPSADQIDVRLHHDRLIAPGVRRTCDEALAALPDGVFVLRDDEPWLVWAGSLLHRTPGGYDRLWALTSGARATVLTPRAIVQTIGVGYAPAVHPSAHALAVSAAHNTTGAPGRPCGRRRRSLVALLMTDG
jgi:hypothetical protein